jgi:hypothetical protein
VPALFLYHIYTTPDTAELLHDIFAPVFVSPSYMKSEDIERNRSGTITEKKFK